MKTLKLKSMTIFLVNGAVQCVRCAVTGRFLKRAVAEKALLIRDASKAAAVKKQAVNTVAVKKQAVNTVAYLCYALAVMFPFAMTSLLLAGGESMHAAINSAGALSIFFSCILALIGMQFHDSSFEVPFHLLKPV